MTSITDSVGHRVARHSRPLPARAVLAQLDELLERLPVAAVKIGQVPTAAVARAAGSPLATGRAAGGARPCAASHREAAAWRRRGSRPLSSSSWCRCRRWSPSTWPRPASSAGVAWPSLARMRDAAAEIDGLRRGRRPRQGRAPARRSRRRAARRRQGSACFDPAGSPGSMHGTGCALASAAAARLACGDDLETAVRTSPRSRARPAPRRRREPAEAAFARPRHRALILSGAISLI